MTKNHSCLPFVILLAIRISGIANQDGHASKNTLNKFSLILGNLMNFNLSQAKKIEFHSKQFILSYSRPARVD